MIYNNIELSEMVCTRISHDLIGNIGALSSALELLGDNNNELDADTRNIISTAAYTLKARQSFFRVAFGLATKNIENSELLDLCQNYLNTIGNRSTPLTVEMNGVTPELSKLACLSIMTAAEVCIRGGHITISINKNNMVIDVRSQYKLSQNKLDIYAGILQNIYPQDNISQYVQLIYLKEILGQEVAMRLDSGDDYMTLTVG